jgi:AraC-like DNA-binding protein
MDFIIIVLLGVVAVQSFLFTVYLTKYSKTEKKSKILQIFTLVLGLHFVNLILGRTIDNYAGFVLSWIFLCSYGPLIYCYIRFFLEDYNKRVYANLFVPIYPLALWIFSNKLHHESSSDQFFDIWVSAPIYGSFLVYLILSLLKIYNAPDVTRNIKWLKYLVLSFTFMVALHLIVLFTFSTGNVQLGKVFYIVEIVYMLFFISGMVYTAMSKPFIFIDIQEFINLIPRPPKYSYTGLTDLEIDSILTEIKSYLYTKKPYLDPGLTLSALSEQTGFEKRHISQVVNDRTGKNFNDFINGYRIMEAISILNKVGGELRIFEVMYSAGFNSKSSFNMSFKRFTGITPTAYRNNILRKNANLIADNC